MRTVLEIDNKEDMEKLVNILLNNGYSVATERVGYYYDEQEYEIMISKDEYDIDFSVE